MQLANRLVDQLRAAANDAMAKFVERQEGNLRLVLGVCSWLCTSSIGLIANAVSQGNLQIAIHLGHPGVEV